jgi:tetratricopeptide (TPR) repeat protein
MSNRFDRVTRTLAAMAMVLSALPAGAQEEPPSDDDVVVDEAAERQERAKWLYTRGAEAFDAGRYLESVKHFKGAAQLVPNPALSYNIGLAYDSMGETTDALSWYRDYLRRVPDAPDREVVVKSIRRLEHALQQLGVQQVTIFSTPEGASVSLDGDVVGRTPWTGETTPGQHRLRVTLEGYAPSVAEFSLSEDRALDVRLVLSEGVEPARPPEPPVARPTTAPEVTEDPAALPPRDSAVLVRPLTWVVLGGGAGFLGGALGMELARAQSEQGARDATTQVDAEQSVDEMERRQTMARVFVAVGAVGTIAGGTLLTFDLKRTRGREAAVSAAVGCRHRGCGVTLGGKF